MQLVLIMFFIHKHITPGNIGNTRNELKDNFIKVECINILLPEENQKLREENTIIKNSDKTNKAHDTNKINELETQKKNLQKSLTEANRKISKKNQRNTAIRATKAVT